MREDAAATSVIRIGVLGTSRVAAAAVIRPAQSLDGVRVIAVGGREPERTRRYAARWKIPVALPDYSAVIHDDDVDLIYNPLPNSLHGQWTLKALAAGKDVLCEKPLAANAVEAAQLRDAASRSGRLLMEGFHYRYHPLAQRILELVKSGELGRPQHVIAKLCCFWFNRQDIRFRYELGGGSLIDTGCYPINLVRAIIGEEPQVQAAEVRLMRPQIDADAAAQLAFPGGATAEIECSLRAAPWRWRSWLHVRCEHGSLSALNPFLPHVFCRLTVETSGARRAEKLPNVKRTTYSYQLEALVRALRTGTEVLTDATDAVGTMRVIDDIYRAAGLPVRQPDAHCS